MRKLAAVVLVMTLTSCVSADEGKLDVPFSDTQRLITVNRDISTENLFSVYMGSDVAQRRLAEMYVVGVLDTSEGTIWCGYEKVSPDGIQEQVLQALKSGLETMPKARASDAIKARFTDLFSCKDLQ